MKKSIYKVLVINVTILLSLSANSFAGKSSHSIPVSCTIPEVPGLNAPLLEERSSATIERWENEPDMQEEKSSKGPSLLQEEKHNLYTFYAR